jgi:A/G-specific adenine glycosylase
MELGALVCTARAPRCGVCPVAGSCAWLARGRPALDQPVKRPQGYAGTDRQVRGRLLALLRESTGPVSADALSGVWDEPVQRARALDGLVADGLVDPLPDGRYALPRRAAVPGR